MRQTFFILAVIAFLVSSCKNTGSETIDDTSKTLEIPYAGNWQRSFMLGVDSLEYVYYNVWSDSIEYMMAGPLPLNYVMQKDTFIVEENRWVGKLHDVYFVVFVKNQTADSLRLFKQQFDTRDEAINRAYPSDTVSGHFSSWYTFYRKE